MDTSRVEIFGFDILMLILSAYSSVVIYGNFEKGILPRHQNWKIYTQEGQQKAFLLDKVDLLVPDINL